tara:strand:+ start:2057 stop:2509 length:453 start_codon:yes stop_codon:yes gene_type:complete
MILNIESSYSIELNNFFSGELKFIQTSLNKGKNSFVESEGVFKRLDDNSILIEVSSPFREVYFIKDEYIEIHDLEFDQITKIPKKEYEKNIFLNYLIDGFEDLNISNNNSNSFLISDKKTSYYFEYLNNNMLQVRFKDNMDVTNLIKFYK